MKNLKLIVIMLIAGILILPNLVAAKDFGKIGFINLSRVFFEYEKSKNLKKSLEDKAKKKDSERKNMVDEIKKMRDEAELLSDKARAEKEPQIEAKIRALQDFDNKTKDVIAKESSEASQAVLQDIETVVNDYAKKENYSIVIDTEAMLYGDDAFNLTDTVIKILNGSYSKSPSEGKK